MKFRTATLWLAALSLLVAWTPVLGQGFELEALHGSKLRQAELESGDWVIVVWANWSPRARNIGARIDQLSQRFGGRARVCGVHFQDTPDEVRRALGRLPGAPLYVDVRGDFSKHYRVTDLPALLVLRGGRVVHRGRLGADAEAVVAPLLETS